MSGPSSAEGGDIVGWQVGARVQARYLGKTRWYAGKITKVRDDGKFDILYDDGDSEDAVLAKHVRLKYTAPAITGRLISEKPPSPTSNLKRGRSDDDSSSGAGAGAGNSSAGCEASIVDLTVSSSSSEEEADNSWYAPWAADLRRCLISASDAADDEIARRLHSGLQDLPVLPSGELSLGGRSPAAFLANHELQEVETLNQLAPSGACQFSSVAHQLYGRMAEPGFRPDRFLRALVVRTMRRNASSYHYFLLDAHPRTRRQQKKGGLAVDFRSYLAKMSQETCDGDHVTLQALADATGCALNVVKWTNSAAGSRGIGGVYLASTVYPRELKRPVVPIGEHGESLADGAGRSLWLTLYGEAHYKSLMLCGEARGSSKPRVKVDPAAETGSQSSGSPRAPPDVGAGGGAGGSGRGDATGGRGDATGQRPRRSSRKRKPKRYEDASLEGARSLEHAVEGEEDVPSVVAGTADDGEAASAAESGTDGNATAVGVGDGGGSADATSATATKAAGSEDESVTLCVICRDEEIGEDQWGDTGGCCSHRFHFECIREWAAVTNKCPLCNVGFKELVRRNASGVELERTEVQERRQRYEPTEDDLLADGFVAAELDALCNVCGGGDADHLLLLCDGMCGTACHTYCIGLSGVPDGDWFCAACEGELSQPGAAAAPAAPRAIGGAAGSRRRRRVVSDSSDDDGGGAATGYDYTDGFVVPDSDALSTDESMLGSSELEEIEDDGDRSDDEDYGRATRRQRTPRSRRVRRRRAASPSRSTSSPGTALRRTRRRYTAAADPDSESAAGAAGEGRGARRGQHLRSAHNRPKRPRVGEGVAVRNDSLSSPALSLHGNAARPVPVASAWEGAAVAAVASDARAKELAARAIESLSSPLEDATSTSELVEACAYAMRAQGEVLSRGDVAFERQLVDQGVLKVLCRWLKPVALSGDIASKSVAEVRAAVARRPMLPLRLRFDALKVMDMLPVQPVHVRAVPLQYLQAVLRKTASEHFVNHPELPDTKAPSLSPTEKRVRAAYVPLLAAALLNKLGIVPQQMKSGGRPRSSPPPALAVAGGLPKATPATSRAVTPKGGNDAVARAAALARQLRRCRKSAADGAPAASVHSQVQTVLKQMLERSKGNGTATVMLANALVGKDLLRDIAWCLQHDSASASGVLPLPAQEQHRALALLRQLPLRLGDFREGGLGRIVARLAKGEGVGVSPPEDPSIGRRIAALAVKIIAHAKSRPGTSTAVSGGGAAAAAPRRRLVAPQTSTPRSGAARRRTKAGGAALRRAAAAAGVRRARRAAGDASQPAPGAGAGAGEQQDDASERASGFVGTVRSLLNHVVGSFIAVARLPGT